MTEAFDGRDSRDREAVYVRSEVDFVYGDPHELLHLAQQKEDHMKAAGFTGELAVAMRDEVNSLIAEAAALELRRNRQALNTQGQSGRPI